jgi:hypothetical protein
MIAPLVDAGLPAGALTAIARSAVFVDVNLLGITGGLLLGSASPEHRARPFQHLMTYGLSAIVAGPHWPGPSSAGSCDQRCASEGRTASRAELTETASGTGVTPSVPGGQPMVSQVGASSPSAQTTHTD